MKFCPVCSSKLDDNATVCSSCGAVLNGRQEVGYKKAEMKPAGGAPNNSVYGNNRIPTNPSEKDDWGNGTIFINPNGNDGFYSDNPYEQNSQPYNQNNVISGDSNNLRSDTSDDDWGNGTVFAGNDSYRSTGNIQPKTPYSGGGMPSQAAGQDFQQKGFNGYNEQRINTPYTPPTQKDKKLSKPKAPKKTINNPFGDIPIGTLILRIVLAAIIIIALIVGIIHGGF